MAKGLMAEIGLLDRQRHGFAQFNTPLVERIDAPDGGLTKYFVFIKCNE